MASKDETFTFLPNGQEVSKSTLIRWQAENQIAAQDRKKYVHKKRKRKNSRQKRRDRAWQEMNAKNPG